MTTIDNVYAQRNELAIAFAKAALAAGWKAGRGIDSEASSEWANVVYVDLPDGRQVSWHISPDCVPLLDGLPQYAGTWDGTFIGREAGWSRGIEAVAQQAEPVHDRHGACPTHCCPVHGCKYMHDDCPVVSGAVQPVYPRNNGCESCADEAEPLNLSDRAVQRRLAAQWGYVHDTQQALTQQKDPTDPGNDVDVLREHVRHLERRVRQLHAQQAEPVAGVVLNEEGRAALVEHGREEWHCVSRNARRLYTAPPQRKLVPLTEAEIEHIGITHQSLRQVARAVERAVWEKNNG